MPPPHAPPAPSPHCLSSRERSSPPGQADSCPLWSAPASEGASVARDGVEGGRVGSLAPRSLHLASGSLLGLLKGHRAVRETGHHRLLGGWVGGGASGEPALSLRHRGPLTLVTPEPARAEGQEAAPRSLAATVPSPPLQGVEGLPPALPTPRTRCPGPCTPLLATRSAWSRLFTAALALEPSLLSAGRTALLGVATAPSVQAAAQLRGPHLGVRMTEPRPGPRAPHALPGSALPAPLFPPRSRPTPL